MISSDESLFDFPCEFPIKVMGEAYEHFDALVVEIVRRHCPDLSEGAVTSRYSQKGKYISVTITIQAHSREQLDSIYMDLTAERRVLMAL